MISAKELAAMFDHTNLKAFASEQDFELLCREAAENHFAMVAINSSPVALCKRLLEGSGVHVGAAISFPLGQTRRDNGHHRLHGLRQIYAAQPDPALLRCDRGQRDD